jgi:hypothetical protein
MTLHFIEFFVAIGIVACLLTILHIIIWLQRLINDIWSKFRKWLKT